MKKRNNKGFSLIELIVAFAMLSAVSLAILFFINSGSNVYTKVTKQNTVQYRSQVVMAQVEQYFNDCNEISVDSADHIMRVRNERDNMVYSFRFIPESKSLYFNSYTWKNGMTAVTPTATEENLLCDCVSEFTVEPDSDVNAMPVKFVTINMTIEVGEKAYTRNRVISCVNSPTYTETGVTTAEREAYSIMDSLLEPHIRNCVAYGAASTNGNQYLFFDNSADNIYCLNRKADNTGWTYKNIDSVKFGDHVNFEETHTDTVDLSTDIKNIAIRTEVPNHGRMNFVIADLEVKVGSETFKLTRTITCNASPVYFTNCEAMLQYIERPNDLEILD